MTHGRESGEGGGPEPSPVADLASTRCGTTSSPDKNNKNKKQGTQTFTPYKKVKLYEAHRDCLPAVPLPSEKPES